MPQLSHQLNPQECTVPSGCLSFSCPRTPRNHILDQESQIQASYCGSKGWIPKGSSPTEICQSCGQGRNPLQPWEMLCEQTWQVPLCSPLLPGALAGMRAGKIRGSWRSLIPGTTAGLQNVLENTMTIIQPVPLALRGSDAPKPPGSKANHKLPSGATKLKNKTNQTQK